MEGMKVLTYSSKKTNLFRTPQAAGNETSL